MTGGRIAARRLCVFCGAKPGSHPRYLDLAWEFGTYLAKLGAGLVYGGCGDGLMGRIALAAHKGGSPVTGVVPRHLIDVENAWNSSGELYVVGSMHDRKALMYRLSDAFVALPGGLGTLDELMEIATWAKLGLHHKPTVVLNDHGYFDPLLAMLERMVEEGFMSATELRLIKVVDGVEGVFELLGWTPATPSEGPPEGGEEGPFPPRDGLSAGPASPKVGNAVSPLTAMGGEHGPDRQ